MKRFTLFTLLFVIFLGNYSTDAIALTYKFNGVFTEIRGSGPIFEDTLSILPGDTFSGTFSYSIEGTPVDQCPTPDLGAYNKFGGVFVDYTINFDTFSISTVVLWNPRIEIRRDEGSFSVVDGHSSSNFDSASLFSDEVRISLYDTTGSAIIDDSLPESLDLTALTTGSMLFTTWGWGDGGPDLYAEYHEVLGSIDSIQACPVPEPASIFLFSFGLVSLVGCYRLLGREKGQ